VGRRLIEFAERCIREEGMVMVMVETVDDSGHGPARRTYEASGYERWPVVRYFKRLR
jgi:GNAT superfamily N-acetyltransferase